MLSERNIINGLILAMGLILGPYLVVTTLEDNQLPFLVFGGCFFLFLIFFIVKDAICVFPLFATFIVGKLNFLPFGLMPPEIFNMVVILYYVVTYLALKQRTLRGGPIYFLFPVVVIASILLYHNHQIGLGALGGSQQGSRIGLLLLIATVAYLSGINIPTPSVSFLARLPWYCLCITCLASLPFAITTYFPSTAPILYHITDQVNAGAYFDSQSAVSSGDSSGAEARAGFMVAVGASLQVFLLSHFPINTWWRPGRWLAAGLSLLALYLVLNGGYRSGFMLFGFVTVIGAWCYCTWRTLIIIPLCGIIFLGLSMIHEDHPLNIDIPISIQRSLSFLPGKWDPEVIQSAEGSNEFRQNIIRVYKQEYLYKSPWIGNGFAQNINEVATYVELSKKDTFDRYYQAKAFIVTKSFHTGWISLYDAVGLIGGAAFLFLGASMLWVSGRFVFGRDADRRSQLFPLKVWLFCNIARDFFGYFTVFGYFGATFPSLCAYAIILIHLLKLERKDVQIAAPSYAEPLGHGEAHESAQASFSN